MAGEEKLGGLYVEVDARTGNLVIGLDQAKKKFDQATKSGENLEAGMRTLGLGFTAFGAAVVGAMTLAVRSYAAAGDAVEHMAERTGLSTKFIQEMRYAAELNGSSLEAMELGLKRMSVTLTNAKEGGEGANRTFARLGLTMQDMSGLSVEQAYGKVMAALGATSDAAERAALAVAIFGRSGTALLPVVADGVEGMKKWTDEAHKYSYVMSDQAVAASHKFSQDCERLQSSMKAVWQIAAEQLIPAIADIAASFQRVLLGVRQFRAEHEVLFGVLVKAITVVGALSLVFGTYLLAAIKFISIAPAMAAACKAIAAGFTLVGAEIAIIAIGLAFLLTQGKELSLAWTIIWRGMSQVVLFAVDLILAALEKALGWIPGIGEKIKEAHKAVLETMEKNSKNFQDVCAQYEYDKATETIIQAGKTAKTKAQIKAEQLQKEKALAAEAVLAEKKRLEEEAETARKILESRAADESKTVRDGLRTKRDMLEADRKWAIDNAKSLSVSIAEINRYYDAKIFEEKTASWERWTGQVDKLLGSLGEITQNQYDAQLQASDAAFDDEISKSKAEEEAITAKWDAEIAAAKKAGKNTEDLEAAASAAEAEAAAKTAALEDAKTAKQKEINRAAAQATKDMSKFTVLANTPAAIMRGIADGGLWGGIAAGIVAAAQLAAIESQPLPALARGGLAYGPTAALVGDNVNAINDPEVISPLSKLRDILGGRGSQTISVYLDGKVLTRAVVEGMPAELRLQGVTI